jgi:peptidoglycan/LPS O-acetylase OafA/YrhL
MTPLKIEIRSLTGLRFVIAFYVFVFHIQIRWPIFDSPVIVQIANQGAIGMTFFFILSGFILSYSYEGKLIAREYFRSRVARIYPIYLFVAILTLPWLFYLNFNPPRLSLLEVLFLFIVDILLLQAWFPPTFGRWNNGGSWSISAEAFFYLCFPSLKKRFDELDARKNFVLFCTFYFLILLVSLSVYLYQNQGMSIAYSMPIFRIIEFIIGMLTFKLFFNRNSPLIKGSVVLLLLFIFLADLIFLGDKLPLYLTHDWIAVPFFVTFLVYLAKSKSWISRLLGGRVFNLLGRASYSFYSLQVFVILLSVKWKSDLQERWAFVGNNQLFALFLVLLITLISILVYQFLEEPLRRKISRRSYR